MSTNASIFQNSISIPQPHLVANQQNDTGITNSAPSIGAYFLPWDNEFLNYNPQYWLLRYKRIHKKTKPGLRRKRVWTHPTHNNGINFPGSNLYSGGQYNHAGLLMPNRETEWLFSSLFPYQITPIVINPMLWFASAGSQTGGFTLPVNYNAWTSNALNIRAIGQHSLFFPGASKSIVFKLAIVIDDPSGNNLKLFGPMSDTIKIYPKLRAGATDDEFYYWSVKIHNDYTKNR